MHSKLDKLGAITILEPRPPYTEIKIGAYTFFGGCQYLF